MATLTENAVKILTYIKDIKSAITAKGHTTNGFETYADAIKNINTDATAMPADVLEGKTFYSNASQTISTGTMAAKTGEKNTSWSVGPNSVLYASSGYYDKDFSRYVTISGLDNTKIDSCFVDSASQGVANITVPGIVTSDDGATWDLTTTVSQSLNSFASALKILPTRIVKGKTILGVTGTADTKVPCNSSNLLYSGYITIAKSSSSSSLRKSDPITWVGTASTIAVRITRASSTSTTYMYLFVIDFHDGVYSIMKMGGTETAATQVEIEDSTWINSISESEIIFQNDSTSYSYSFQIMVFGDSGLEDLNT